MSQIAALPHRQAESARARGEALAPELSVIIPTFKERGNVALLVQRLGAALAGIAWEAIFVDDDSPDGTAEAVKAIAAQDNRVRCLRRLSRRGLAGACIEGVLASSAPFIAVMDADLQHDEVLLPGMLALLKSGETDLVVGSRYSAGGNADVFTRRRDAISRFATSLARRLTGVTLSDPMSGFFMMRRDRFDPLAPSLSTQGFKILLDIVITARGRLRIVEQPYVFAARKHGESKLDAQVGLDFLGLLLAKLTGGVVTPRFLSFALVGTIGLGVHLAILRAAMTGLDLTFPVAQATGTFAAMTGNFILNNRLTYRDRRLSGIGFVKGLVGFYAVSAVGALTNVGMASWLYAHQPVWWLAGAAGAVMGAVWNYSMATLLVWRVK
jgi:dolichol-phosphate mannosyltransferase